MTHDWLRWQFIHECSATIEEHADMLGQCARTGNEEAARMHFECIRYAARSLDQTLKEIEAQVPLKKLAAKEAA